MKISKIIFILIISSILFISCEINNSTKRKLIEIRNSNQTNEIRYQYNSEENVEVCRQDGIEYGRITLEDSETVKYWFQSHHNSEDGFGGTLFELPNGDLKFIKGYFCCEVQLPNNGKFKNSKIFLQEIEKLDGIKP